MKLRDQIEHLEYMFNFEINRLSDFLENLIEMHRKEEDYFKDSGREFFELLPNYYFNSFVIRIYSLLESEMFEICDSLLRYNNILLVCEKDLTGSSVEKFKKCLTKMFHLEINNDLWKEIDNLRLVRNTIVHRESILSEHEKKKIKEYMQYHNLTSDMVESILTNQKYCQHIHDFCCDFIQEMYSLVKKEYKEENEYAV